jgi:hypothetical protein
MPRTGSCAIAKRLSWAVKEIANRPSEYRNSGKHSMRSSTIEYKRQAHGDTDGDTEQHISHLTFDKSYRWIAFSGSSPPPFERRKPRIAAAFFFPTSEESNLFGSVVCHVPGAHPVEAVPHRVKAPVKTSY